MGKSVTVKAPTVELAVEQALAELGVGFEDVRIEVIEQPGRSLYGLKKKMAEVNVTQLKLRIPVTVGGSEEVTDGARLVGKQVEVVHSVGELPIIEPGHNVKIFVNGKRILGPVPVNIEDEIRVQLNDEIIPPQYTIRLIEQNIIAILTVTPGKRIKRQLRNTDFRKMLFIEADEYIEPFNNLSANDIMSELEEMGITERIDQSTIEVATSTSIPYEAIVSKGHLPVEGFNGDIYLHARGEDISFSEHGKVDFREMNPIVSVEENDLIATYLPAVPGVNGMDLFGHPVPTKEVRDLSFRLGEQVEMRGNEIVALSCGRVLLEKHGSLMKIEVKSEFVHNGDVNLSSGNIRFNGDVRIGRDVDNSMYVGATGKVFIGGTIRKATIEAGKSASIEGNVFSSTVKVGMQEVLEEILASQLSGLLSYLDQMQATILQIIHIRGVRPEEVDAGELKDLVRIILKEKYLDFQHQKREFIQKVKNHSTELSSDWMPLVDKLYNVFTDTSLTAVRNAEDFSRLLEEAHALIEEYSEGESCVSILKLPYAINSVLSCNGTIDVTEAGLYNCSVTAKEQVFIDGCCRGGEITAGQKISIKETGSTNSVKTVLKTESNGTITIGLARCGTEIWIGDKVHYFEVDKLGVHARIVGGELQIS